MMKSPALYLVAAASPTARPASSPRAALGRSAPSSASRKASVRRKLAGTSTVAYPLCMA